LITTARGNWKYDVSWFVTLIVGATLISWILDLIIGRDLPIQPASRVILLAQLFFLIGVNRTAPKMHRLPNSAVYPLVAFTLSIFTSFALALGTETESAVRAFIFMHSVSVFLIMFVFLPIHMRSKNLFRAVLIFSILFGVAQLWTQDLLFSDQVRFALGLEFDFFVNGRLRLTGLFASKARFGEAVTLALAFVFASLLKGDRPKAQLLLFAALMLLLYNSYSRAGYLLAVVTIFAIIAMYWQKLRKSSSSGLLFLIGLVGITTILSLGISASMMRELQVEQFDLQSFWARLSHWDTLRQSATARGLLSQFFGSGQAAMFSRSEVDYFVIDNLFLSLYFYGGLVGLATFLVLFFAITRAAKHYDKEGNMVPLRAFTIGLFFEGIFLDNHNTLFLALFAILALIGNERTKSADQRVPVTSIRS